MIAISEVDFNTLDSTNACCRLIDHERLDEVQSWAGQRDAHIAEREQHPHQSADALRSMTHVDVAVLAMTVANAQPRQAATAKDLPSITKAMTSSTAQVDQKASPPVVGVESPHSSGYLSAVLQFMLTITPIEIIVSSGHWSGNFMVDASPRLDDCLAVLRALHTICRRMLDSPSGITVDLT